MRMKLILISLLLMTGCASDSSAHRQASAGPHGECTVCKKNADLACVDVAIDDKTPRFDYRGKTYYFCSNECRSEFIKHPAKYALSPKGVSTASAIGRP